MDLPQNVISRNQRIHLSELEMLGVELWLKREDEIHEEISGNKWRKLRYHMLEAISEGAKGILSYGGAYSNHIAATAAACHSLGLESIGIIRGERIEPLNSTLSRASVLGMRLYFVSRKDYREQKIELANNLDPEGNYHLVPEGAADQLGVKGCSEILTAQDVEGFDQFACASGTGATAAGILLSLNGRKMLGVYPALKGDFIYKDIESLVGSANCIGPLKIVDGYHFGGYAKTNTELLAFIRSFYTTNGIKLDPIYTSKMVYGLMSDIRKGFLQRGTRILAIHSGGIQGARGIEIRENIILYPDSIP